MVLCDSSPSTQMAQTLVSLIVSDVVDLSPWLTKRRRRERVAMARESSSPLDHVS